MIVRDQICVEVLSSAAFTALPVNIAPRNSAFVNAMRIDADFSELRA
jgi:hypothetical protein